MGVGRARASTSRYGTVRTKNHDVSRTRIEATSALPAPSRKTEVQQRRTGQQPRRAGSRSLFVPVPVRSGTDLTREQWIRTGEANAAGAASANRTLAAQGERTARLPCRAIDTHSRRDEALPIKVLRRACGRKASSHYARPPPNSRRTRHSRGRDKLHHAQRMS